jgi:hypothetical protein
MRVAIMHECYLAANCAGQADAAQYDPGNGGVHAGSPNRFAIER